MSALTSFGKTVSRNRNIVLAYVAMLVLLTAVSIYRPGFGWGDPRHLRALVLQAAVIGLASMGQTWSSSAAALTSLCHGPSPARRSS